MVTPPPSLQISDTLEEEREEGRSFESSLLGLMTSHQCRCTLVDTPGHPALTQRAVSAAAQVGCSWLPLSIAAARWEPQPLASKVVVMSRVTGVVYLQFDGLF